MHYFVTILEHKVNKPLLIYFIHDINKLFSFYNQIIRHFINLKSYLPTKYNYHPTRVWMHPTLRSRAYNVFGVQLYKNNARALLSHIWSILIHACSVCGVYEFPLIGLYQQVKVQYIIHYNHTSVPQQWHLFFFTIVPPIQIKSSIFFYCVMNESWISRSRYDTLIICDWYMKLWKYSTQKYVLYKWWFSTWHHILYRIPHQKTTKFNTIIQSCVLKMWVH